MNGKGEKESLEYIISTTLRLGVWCSFWICLTGTVLLFLNYRDKPVDIYHFQNIPPKFNLSDLWTGILKSDAVQIAMLGVLIMLITPLLRVIFALYTYKKQGNNLYVLITGIVIIIISISIWLGTIH